MATCNSQTKICKLNKEPPILLIAKWAWRIKYVSHIIKIRQRPAYEAIQTIIEFKSGSEGRGRQREIKLFNNFKTKIFNLESI